VKSTFRGKNCNDKFQVNQGNLNSGKIAQGKVIQGKRTGSYISSLRSKRRKAKVGNTL
jgi:uncharacterized protein (DUF342 family)